MNTQNEWKERGQRAVGAATDLAAGLFKGLQNIGSRVQSAQYKPIVEAFCAWCGLMAAQKGRLKRTEIEAFRNFLLQNRQHPVFGGFPIEELIDKFKEYAVKAFLEEDAVFHTVLHPIPQDSEEARLIVTGCLNVIYADGYCDDAERQQLDLLAQRLGINTEIMARKMGIILPPTNPAATPYYGSVGQAAVPSGGSPFQAMPAPQAYAPPPPPPQAAPSPPPPVASVPPAGGQLCGMCQGKGCVFCNQTGYKG
ncbi:MAG: TerB family tellurite resistance protein [Magnetococcales bacterium]|nr:TerB family tellurite resistance protein [Magnetococcales bacterium]NGZ05754.1 TerB family tellurite resistance protein [Magnetococcales bacterium]